MAAAAAATGTSRPATGTRPAIGYARLPPPPTRCADRSLSCRGLLLWDGMGSGRTFTSLLRTLQDTAASNDHIAAKLKDAGAQLRSLLRVFPGPDSASQASLAAAAAAAPKWLTVPAADQQQAAGVLCTLTVRAGVARAGAAGHRDRSERSSRRWRAHAAVSWGVAGRERAVRAGPAARVRVSQGRGPDSWHGAAGARPHGAVPAADGGPAPSA